MACTIAEIERHSTVAHESWWRARIVDALRRQDEERVHLVWMHTVLSGMPPEHPRADPKSLRALRLASGDEWSREARDLIGILDPGLREQARLMLHERASNEYMKTQDPGAGIAFAASTPKEDSHETGRYLVIALREHCEALCEHKGKQKGLGRRLADTLAMILVRTAESNTRANGGYRD